MHEMVAVLRRVAILNRPAAARHLDAAPACRIGKGRMKMDIHCNTDLEWNGSRNVGSILTPAGNLPYSAPGLTGSGGAGPSLASLLAFPLLLQKSPMFARGLATPYKATREPLTPDERISNARHRNRPHPSAGHRTSNPACANGLGGRRPPCGCGHQRRRARPGR